MSSPEIEEALQATKDRSFVDLDPIFNHNLDEDFDFRASGITRSSFCSVYFDWIQFCFERNVESQKSKHNSESQSNHKKSKCMNKQSQSLQLNPTEQNVDEVSSSEQKETSNQSPSPHTSKSEKINENNQQMSAEIVSLRCSFEVY